MQRRSNQSSGKDNNPPNSSGLWIDHHSRVVDAAQVPCYCTRRTNQLAKIDLLPIDARLLPVGNRHTQRDPSRQAAKEVHRHIGRRRRERGREELGGECEGARGRRPGAPACFPMSLSGSDRPAWPVGAACSPTSSHPTVGVRLRYLLSRVFWTIFLEASRMEAMISRAIVWRVRAARFFPVASGHSRHAAKSTSHSGALRSRCCWQACAQWGGAPEQWW